MSLGRRIRGLRTKQGLSQQQLAKKTGLGISYLSRVENDRVSPTSRTLIKLSLVLKVSPGSFFDSDSMEESDRCPVSLDGRCVLDHPSARRGPRIASDGETYSREHLQLLHSVNVLLHHGSPEANAALKFVVHNMLEMLPTSIGTVDPAEPRARDQSSRTRQETPK